MRTQLKKEGNISIKATTEKELENEKWFTQKCSSASSTKLTMQEKEKEAIKRFELMSIKR